MAAVREQAHAATGAAEARDGDAPAIVLRDVSVRYPGRGEAAGAGAGDGAGSDTAGRSPSPASAATPASTPAATDTAVDALHGVSLTIRAGEHVCILGANGSGKSTLVQLMGALMAPTAGTVEILGIDAATPEGAVACRRRTAMVFQHPDDQMVTSIVADDVAFGPENLGVPQPEIVRRVDAALEAVGMASFADADPADLSGGQRQRVAIAGALAMEPAVLLLDEPAAMLDVRGRQAIQRIVRRLNERGITIVHVTHFMDDALLAGRVVVLEHGRVALDGTPDEVFAHTDAIRRLGLDLPFTMRLAERLERALSAGGPLPRSADPDEVACAIAARIGAREADAAEPAGRENADAAHTGTARTGATPAAAADGTAPALAFHDVTFSYALDERARAALRRRGGPLAHLRARRAQRQAATAPLALEHVSFTVPAGTLTALIGHTGSGKSTSVELACALKLPLTGTVAVAGIDTADRARRRELRAQIGYVSQFPERQLFAETVYDDVAFGPRNLGLSEDAVRERVLGALSSLGLPADEALLGRSPFALSGGQQRSVALAGVIAMQTPILVLDEPMAGLDPAGRQRMRALMRRLKTAGTTLLLVTHDMDDVAELADHVIALAAGRVVAEGAPAAVFTAANADRLPGMPSARSFARRLREHGVMLPEDPLTLDDLVWEVAHGAAR